MPGVTTTCARAYYGCAPGILWVKGHTMVNSGVGILKRCIHTLLTLTRGHSTTLRDATLKPRTRSTWDYPLMLFGMVIMPFLNAEIMPLPIRAIMPKLCPRRELCRNYAALKWAQNFLKRRAWPKLGRAKLSSSLGCRNWAGNCFWHTDCFRTFPAF